MVSGESEGLQDGGQTSKEVSSVGEQAHSGSSTGEGVKASQDSLQALPSDCAQRPLLFMFRIQALAELDLR